MFDTDDKTLLFLGLLVASFVALAAQSVAPDEGGPVHLDIAALPALPPDLPDGGAPLQTEVPEETFVLTEDFNVTLMFGYVLEGEVVSRRRFHGGAAHEVSPLDLGIVWGDLDIDNFEFSAGNRALWTRINEAADPPDGWDAHVTNNHLLPATNDIRADLMAVEIGQQVRIEGYLVTVTGDRISPWRSSTRRDDSSIIGGCEIILVTGVEVLEPHSDLSQLDPA